MSKHRNVAAAAVSAMFVVGACSSPEHASKVQGTVPAVWTGSGAPSASPRAGGEQPQQPAGQPPQPAGQPLQPAGQPPQPAGQSITTQLKAPDGTEVATAKFDFGNGYATVTIATTGGGHLTPGFHGVHIHQVGKCEPNSVAPTGGAPGDFLSAGGHFQAPGHSAEPASGDLTSLEVRKDGSGTLVTTTDAFSLDDLRSGEKTAIIIHAGADNFGNIPPERYKQTNGTPGPDQTTMTTGDAGKRVACGVIGAG